MIRTTRHHWTAEHIRALGVTTDLVTAGSILGIGRTKSHELARNNEFPVPILRIGHRYHVPISGLLNTLGIPDHNDISSSELMTGPLFEHMGP